MKRTGWSVLRVALALLAAVAWSLVYPRDDPAATFVLGASVAVWLLLALTRRGVSRASVTYLAVASVLAAGLAHAWTAIASHGAVWMPELPRVLHGIFGTDGEASYNAAVAQLFLVLFGLLTAVGWLSRRLRMLLIGHLPDDLNGV